MELEWKEELQLEWMSVVLELEVTSVVKHDGINSIHYI